MRNLRLPGRMLPAALLLSAVGCEFPTQAPKWHTTWIVPGDNVEIEASSFFPSGVTLSAQEDAFLVSLPTISFQRTLGEMCGGACQALNGATAPKPAFGATLSASTSLPADVVSAAISGGEIDLHLSHNLSFDPLRPSATARGSVVITARSGSTVLAQETISGTSNSFAPNTLVRRTLRLSPATVEGPIDVIVTVNSPAGDPVRIDTSQRLAVQALPGEVRASQARVRFAGSRSVTGSEFDMSMGGIDPELSRNVRSATLHLDVSNPFAVEGTLRLQFRADGETITKTLQLRSGTTAGRVDFTSDEIRSLFDSSEVVLIPSGTFTSPSGVLTVVPGQAIGVDSRLELVVGPES